MSDLDTWTQRALREDLGIRVSVPSIRGLQEGRVTKVGTAYLQILPGAPVSYHVVWFALVNTVGEGPGYGPAAYQQVPGWTPTVGALVIVGFVGNDTGRPYVISFPGATPT